MNDAPTSAPDGPVTALLLGNPNVGKTSLFNHLTGQRARVGNYPGITVERRVGAVTLEATRVFDLIDAPGIYSLSARSYEEQIALWEVLGLTGGVAPKLLIAVVDAGQLARCLYLVLQLLELRIPLVLALNMADEAGAGCPSPERLEEELGVPVVVTDGRRGSGLEQLKQRAVSLLGEQKPFVPHLAAHYSADLRQAADRVADALPAGLKGSVERNRALGYWALSSIEPDDELEGIPPNLRSAALRAHETCKDVDLELTVARYEAIDAALQRAGHEPSHERAHMTERIDRILLHPLLGFLAFCTTMFVVFQALFAWADPAIGLLEDTVGLLGGFAQQLLPEGILRDLLVEGVIGGVGNVIVFLPQILLLFLFIGLLEDSGYMARVAYLMDRIMRSLGLHGRAFVPMLSGFACAIPAILATRTLERRRDRLLTIMVIPLMTCSARLPVYSLIIAALFPIGSWGGLPVQGLLLLAMYLLSVGMAMIAAWVLGRTVIKGQAVPLILELPPYRLPRAGPTLLMIKSRAFDFLREAGGIILVATILLWALLHFPEHPKDTPDRRTSRTELAASQDTNPDQDALDEAARLKESYGGQLGQLLEPALRPLGFDWKIATGIIGAFAAREVFISTMGLVYGVGEVEGDAAPLREKLKNEKRPDGTPRYTPVVGLSLMVFFALACQCMSTLAVVRRETRSYFYPTLLFGYMTTLAYLCSLIVYQIGSRL